MMYWHTYLAIETVRTLMPCGRVVLNRFSAEDIGAAKKLLCCEFHGKLAGDAPWTERRSSTSRAAHEAEIDDILVIFDTLDVQSSLEAYLFVSTNLSALPKFGPEEINIAAIADRQARLEEALSSNITTLKPDAVQLEQRLNAMEAAISSQLEKLTLLSDQLSATATLVKESGSTAHTLSHGQDRGAESTRDRSTNVVVFGIVTAKVGVAVTLRWI